MPVRPQLQPRKLGRDRCRVVYSSGELCRGWETAHACVYGLVGQHGDGGPLWDIQVVLRGDALAAFGHCVYKSTQRHHKETLWLHSFFEQIHTSPIPPSAVDDGAHRG